MCATVFICLLLGFFFGQRQHKIISLVERQMIITAFCSQKLAIPQFLVVIGYLEGKLEYIYSKEWHVTGENCGF